MNCPLCQSQAIAHFHKDKKRSYLRCFNCFLIFVPEEFLPPATLEKNRYLQHENTFENKGYVKFLWQFLDPLLERILPGSNGLDFGSGPNPVLAKLLEESGYKMKTYDPFFSPELPAFEQHFDFLTCVETAEHFFSPLQEWQRICGLIKPGGWIGVKTEMVLQKTDFATWHYKNDFTHVCFYAKESFDWIAERFKLKVEFVGNSTLFLQSGTRKA